MEKSDKVEAGMARGGPAVDPSGGGVQRGIQRKSAMPVIFKAVTLDGLPLSFGCFRRVPVP